MITLTRYSASRLSLSISTALRAMVFSLILLFSACASLKPTQSGFLTDYSALRPTTNHPNDPSFRKVGVDTAHYSAFVLEPVAFRPVRPIDDLDQATIDELTTDYQEKLRSAFAKHLRETTASGPGVIRIRAAVTDVERSNPVLNAVTMAAVLLPVTAGGASTEAEVVDSVSGERLAALEGVNNGGRSFLGGPIGYLSKYGHARRAFSKQADELLDRVFVEMRP